MLKAGVVGCGHLGKIHTKLLFQSENYKLIGVYDINAELSNEIAKEYGCKAYTGFEEMLNDIEVLDIVTPTPFHFNYAKKAIDKGIHLFIEKPVCSNTEESTELLRLSESNNIKIQVGHVERFNPAYITVEENISKPMFIESHRLAKFNPRGTDVSVVLDLMIHDIDIILNSVKSPVKTISSNGISVISDSPDIANARIEFEDGCIANLTSSRISLKKMRKTRIFQEDAYISINFLEKDYQVVRIRGKEPNDSDSSIIIKNNVGEEKVIFFETPELVEINSIESELIDFFESIHNNSESKVPLSDGLLALEVAEEIISQL